MNGIVLVLNASYEYLSVTTMRRALRLLCKGKATVIEALEGKWVRSADASLETPSVIRMNYYIKRPFKEVVLSRRNVIDRDDHTCQYCGGPGDTIDHIKPKSRGGKNTWTNLVCSCSPCNRRKGDKTPEEAGMPLLSTPRQPSAIPWLHQRKVKSRSDWKEYLFL